MKISHHVVPELSRVPLGITTLMFAIAFISLAPGKSMALEIDCDSDFVSVVGAEIRVAQNGDDDTENLSCALNEATRLGVQKVKLERGEYLVSSTVEVGGFRGQFEGVTRDSTTIVVADQAFECAADGSGGAAFAFALGAPSVKFMRFEVADPCLPSAFAFAVLAFTSDPADCSRRILFGSVDRVDIIRDGNGRYLTSAVYIERAPGCPADLPPLGTFTLNRSDIQGFLWGLYTSMGGGAPVDVNFNSFTRNEHAAFITNAKQNTTVTGNDITYGEVVDPLWGFNSGIAVASNEGGRDGNRAVVHDNRFFDAGLSSVETEGVLVFALTRRIKQSVYVTSNRFEMNGGSANKGVGVYDVDAGAIQNNQFVGASEDAIAIGPFFSPANVEGWAISGNTFSAYEGTMSDIRLLEGTIDSYVGPQDAIVVAPEGNFIAEQ